MGDHNYAAYPCCGSLVFHQGGERCDAYRHPPANGIPTSFVEPQPPPVASESPAVWPLVIGDLRNLGEDHNRLADLAERRHAFGQAKYGTPLRVENGREPLFDALQEALDAMAYTRQHYERVRQQNKGGEVAAWRLHRNAITFALELLEAVQVAP